LIARIERYKSTFALALGHQNVYAFYRKFCALNKGILFKISTETSKTYIIILKVTFDGSQNTDCKYF
jgi:hypothetical protein